MIAEETKPTDTSGPNEIADVMHNLDVDVCAMIDIFRENTFLATQQEASPIMVCADIIGRVCQILDDKTHPGAVTQAVLMAFEGRHEEPMNFMQVARVKEVLTEMAAARRKAEATKSAIILPGSA